MAIHGANMYGEDKISFADRVKWTEDNEAWIIKCAEDPMSNRQWEDASNPFQFLAFCDEWKRFKEQGYGFVSRIPVNVDGSCNGLQIYSLMLRDSKAGKLVNLTPTDKPQDIYQLVANAVIEKLKKDAEENKPFAQLKMRYSNRLVI